MRASYGLICAVCVLAVAAVGCVKPARLLKDGRYEHGTDNPNPAFENDMWGCLAGRMDVVDVTVTPTSANGVPAQVLRVEGFTEMPDRSDIVVGIRPIGTRVFKTWATVHSAGSRYAADLGPFTAVQLPPGTYVVEAKWLPHRQDPLVRDAANQQDLNMVHRDRDMDSAHYATKLVRIGEPQVVPVEAPVVPADVPAPVEGAAGPTGDGAAADPAPSGTEAATPGEAPPADGTPVEDGTK